MADSERVRLRDHWAATEDLWSHRGAALAWHVLPAGQLDLLAEWLRPFLERPPLTPVPAEWLHLTTQAVAPAREIGAETLDRLVAEVGTRCAELPPIAARVGPVHVVEDGVTGDVLPAEPLTALQHLLQDADADVRGRDAVPDWRAPFRPHVTFAYASSADEIDQIETVASGELVVDTVTLLLLSRGGRRYTWEVVAAVPLGGSGE